MGVLILANRPLKISKLDFISHQNHYLFLMNALGASLGFEQEHSYRASHLFRYTDSNSSCISPSKQKFTGN